MNLTHFSALCTKFVRGKNRARIPKSNLCRIASSPRSVSPAHRCLNPPTNNVGLVKRAGTPGIALGQLFDSSRTFGDQPQNRPGMITSRPASLPTQNNIVCRIPKRLRLPKRKRNTHIGTAPVQSDAALRWAIHFAIVGQMAYHQ
jgi:hypothetical protein